MEPIGNFYVTGDTHGVFARVIDFCNKVKTTKHDVLIILGDAGVNYYLDKRDKKLKQKLEALPITLMLVRGNHEARPGTGWNEEDKKDKFISAEEYCGFFMYESEFPSILYMEDGEHYTLNVNGVKKRTLVIGGAYSVDKDYRLEMYDLGNHNYRWFADEQLSQSERALIVRTNEHADYDYVFTHTCPAGYEPRDMFLPNIDQSKIDRTMENFLADIKDEITFDKWYCGHWHTNRIDGDIHFLFNDIIQLQ